MARPETETLPEAELQAIEERAHQATEPPWTACFMVDEDGNDCLTVESVIEGIRRSASKSPSGRWFGVVYEDRDADGTQRRIAETGNGPASEANALFLAAARRDVPVLVAEVRRLRTERGRLRADLADLAAAVTEQCNGQRMIATRAEIAKTLYALIEQRLPVGHGEPDAD